MRFSPALCAVSLLVYGAGCLTKYQPLRPTGGYYEIPAADGRTTVVIASNGSRMGPVLDAWLMHRCAQVTINAGHSYFRVLAKGDEAPGANEYGSYRTATIEMLDGPAIGEVFEAKAIAASTSDLLIGPERYQ